LKALGHSILVPEEGKEQMKRRIKEEKEGGRKRWRKEGKIT
jgi:hypothetical protein